MVFFSCNACGDTVKKNQVEKHLFRCRQCTVLSCLDCCKDFHGQDYQSHVKCITEEEKYSGKGFKPKGNADKGEKKQEEWLAILRQSISTANVREPLRQVLEKLATFNNVPRKQQKFENFTRQCVFVNNASLIKEAWDVFSKAFEAAKKPPSEQDKAAQPEENQSAKSEMAEENKNEPKKLSKRERKEARQKQSKVEKKDTREVLPVAATEAQPQESEEPSSKRKRKRKANGEEAGDCVNGHSTTEAQSQESEEPSRKRKRKHKANGEEADESVNGHTIHEVHQSEDNAKSSKKKKKNKHGNVETQEERDGDELAQKRNGEDESGDATEKAEKFKWTEIVKSLLEAADEHELSVKKLKKKVVAEYMSRCYSKPTTKEELEAKLLKRIQKNPLFKLHKDRVKLVV